MLQLSMGFFKNNSGATAIEYAVIGSLISLVIIAGLSFVGTEMNQNYSIITETIDEAINE